jgi:opacity protein-like surface antigen
VLEPDNEGGWHLCGGLTIDLGKHLEVFAEYRYSWIKFTVDTDEWDFEKVDEDWTYGLARVGLNLVL